MDDATTKGPEPVALQKVLKRLTRVNEERSKDILVDGGTSGPAKVAQFLAPDIRTRASATGLIRGHDQKGVARGNDIGVSQHVERNVVCSIVSTASLKTLLA